MADEQDRAEALDEDAEPITPPDHLLGAAAYGAAGTDPPGGETVAQRAAREEPEDRPGPTDAVEPDDPTLHDIAVERSTPQPAEEAALHVIDDPAEPVAPEAIEADDLRAPERR